MFRAQNPDRTNPDCTGFDLICKSSLRNPDSQPAVSLLSVSIELLVEEDQEEEAGDEADKDNKEDKEEDEEE